MNWLIYKEWSTAKLVMRIGELGLILYLIDHLVGAAGNTGFDLWGGLILIPIIVFFRRRMRPDERKSWI